MKFIETKSETGFDQTVFEIDDFTNFSEQYVAINALGSHVLTLKEDKDRVGASFLAAKIKKSLPSNSDAAATEQTDKPKPVITDLSPYEAYVLSDALKGFVDSTLSDINKSGSISNYQAVFTRVVEQELAKEMLAKIEQHFLLDPVKLANSSNFGFIAAL
jgi:hypothetical protein